MMTFVSYVNKEGMLL